MGRRILPGSNALRAVRFETLASCLRSTRCCSHATTLPPARKSCRLHARAAAHHASAEVGAVPFGEVPLHLWDVLLARRHALLAERVRAQQRRHALPRLARHLLLRPAHRESACCKSQIQRAIRDPVAGSRALAWSIHHITMSDSTIELNGRCFKKQCHLVAQRATTHLPRRSKTCAMASGLKQARDMSSRPMRSASCSLCRELGSVNISWKRFVTSTPKVTAPVVKRIGSSSCDGVT